MAIEFRCTTCQKLLRTEMGTEGKKAKCPQCGTILTVPSPDAASFAPPPAGAAGSFEAPPPRDPGTFAPPRSAEAAANPFSSPGTIGRAESVTQRGFHPTRIEFGEILSRTWQIFKSNMGMCIAGALIVFICSMVTSWILQVLFLPVMFAVDDDGARAGLSILQSVLGQAVSSFFYVGLVLFMLRIARGEQAEIGQLFSGMPYFLQAFAIQIIVTLATMLGLLLLIIPGIIIALMWSQATFMIVDQKADIGQALKMSAAAMKGNKLTALAIYLVSGIVGTVIGLLTCCIGFLFVAPFLSLLLSVIYLGVTGQPTMLDAAPQANPTERPFGAQPT